MFEIKDLEAVKEMRYASIVFFAKEVDCRVKSKFSPDSIQHPVVKGAAAAWPICLGYIPIGLAFGVIAQKAGFQPVEIALMSLLVFAGSAQFIAVSMLADGAAAGAVVLTTFMVNLRHLLMSSALSMYLKKIPWLRSALFAYGVTDESFAINMSRFRAGGWQVNQAIALNQTANFSWLFSTVAGGLGGRFIPTHAFGIDYALIAMFICLLTLQIRGVLYLLTALIAAAAAVLMASLLPGNLHIVAAAVFAASAGVGIHRLMGKRAVR